MSEQTGSELTLVGERNVNLGNVFNCQFYPSVPYLLAACGTSQDLCLWDVREVDALAGVFDAAAGAGAGAGVESTPEKVEFEASGDARGTLNELKKKKKNK